MNRYALLALLLAVAPAFAASSISKVNGSIDAESGPYDELSTVNGSIRIDAGVEVAEAETVNGRIEIGDDAVVGTADTVNGRITIGRQARVERDASTVNGAISLDIGAHVGGNVETVNGGISTEQARIAGRIETVGGSISVGAGSEVGGGIVVNRQRGGWFNFGNNTVPRVEIGADAVVGGELRFDREVELIVHPSATIGPIVGDAAGEIRIVRR